MIKQFLPFCLPLYKALSAVIIKSLKLFASVGNDETPIVIDVVWFTWSTPKSYSRFDTERQIFLAA